jgi:AAA15 family ATPase/GTPase
MLISFRTENFRSIRDEAELSMVVPSWVETPHVTTPVSEAGEINVGSVAGILGSNASGKTSLLRAIWQMSVMVANSHQRWKPKAPIPYSPFFAGPHKSKETMFDVDFTVDGARYQYGFRFTAEQITEEWLYTFPRNRPRLLFDRDVKRSDEFRFGRTLRGKAQVIAGLTRSNSLFLSAAAANNHQQLTPVAEWLDAGFLRSDPSDRQMLVKYTLAHAREDDRRKRKMLDLLRSADLGIEDFRIVDQEMDEELKARVADVMKVLNHDQVMPDLDWREIAQEVQFGHRSGSDIAFLDVVEESDGTRAWIALVGAVLYALEGGRVLIVDDLVASLHPKLSGQVVQIFHDAELNTNGAQLVFNTHDPSLLGVLLGEAPLRRDEVWLTEKGRDGGTRLYPLTDFKPRKAENLERGYMQGRYGGVPYVDEALALAALGRGREGN